MLRVMTLDDIKDQKYGYKMGVHYMDVVNNCEKLGDYIINVVEAHAHIRLTYQLNIFTGFSSVTKELFRDIFYFCAVENLKFYRNVRK